MSVAFVFKSSPYNQIKAREGLDALLALANYSQDISVFFIDYGILNLVSKQQVELLKQKDHLSSFKLLDLYEIEQRYICQDSIKELGLEQSDWLIDLVSLERSQIIEKLQSAAKILTF